MIKIDMNKTRVIDIHKILVVYKFGGPAGT